MLQLVLGLCTDNQHGEDSLSTLSSEASVLLCYLWKNSFFVY